MIENSRKRLLGRVEVSYVFRGALKRVAVYLGKKNRDQLFCNVSEDSSNPDLYEFKNFDDLVDRFDLGLLVMPLHLIVHKETLTLVEHNSFDIVIDRRRTDVA